MRDARIERMAQVLVEYSLALKAGDLLVIRGQDVTAPLIQAVYEAALRVGAHPEVLVSLPGLAESLLKTGTDAQLEFVSPFTRYTLERADAYLSLLGEANLRALSGVDPQRQALRARAMSDTNREFMQRAARGEVRWSLAQFPTNADAQEASMSLTDYEDFVFRACGVYEDDPVAYWHRISQEQERLIALLNTFDTLQIVGEGTDLTLRIGGRTWINCAGKENYPDGEIFTGPIEDSAQGQVRFSFPGIYRGHQIEDIMLTFEKGKVVKATARQGEQLLHALLATDPGASFLGEIGIGTNYGITRPTRNMLFDEKIGGTVHLAIGSGYPESGSKNDSAIHWDMLCDLREGGRILADGRLIYEDGRFVI